MTTLEALAILESAVLGHAVGRNSSICFAEAKDSKHFTQIIPEHGRPAEQVLPSIVNLLAVGIAVERALKGIIALGFFVRRAFDSAARAGGETVTSTISRLACFFFDNGSVYSAQVQAQNEHSRRLKA